MRQQLTTHTKQCGWCKKEFLSQRSDARFCTSSCRSYAYRTDPVVHSEMGVKSLVTESSKEEVFVTSQTWAEVCKEDWSANPQPYHEEIWSVQRIRHFTSPSRLDLQGEVVSALHRVLHFRNEATLQLYIEKNLPSFKEGEEPWFIKGNKLYFPVDMQEQ
ncbi:hypothetical protein HRG84_02595 [Flavisolibacter sp. BT320]|nr:hypothetical protein [Flavisolibacter longurius]